MAALPLLVFQVTLTIDPAGEVIVNDGAGHVDTLRRFSTIQLSEGTVTVSGVTLTDAFGAAEVGNPGSGYALAGIGDLNGDGKADLLFSKAGALASWDLSGASIVGGGSIGSPGSGWAVAGIADLGTAGHNSIVFDNASTGQVATWLINDTSIIGGGTVGTATGYGVIGVR